MRWINWIFLHCSAGYGDVEAIRRFWREDLGWKSDGYHDFIYLDGKVEELTSYDKIVNGVRGYNGDGIHISTQGGVDPLNYKISKDTRTDEQKASILERISYSLNFLKVYQPIDHIRICGHRDASPDKNGNGVIEPWERIKDCPSYDAIPEYDWITANPGSLITRNNQGKIIKI